MDVDGVLIHSKDSGRKGTEKYEHHTVVLSALTVRPYLWQVPTNLNLYLFITHTDYPPPVYTPRAGYEFFFYTKYNPMVTPSIILFRGDLKPLHPKQVQALWKFLGYLKKKFNTVDYVTQTAEGLQNSRPPDALTRDDQSDRIWTLAEFWKDYCTMDNFSAFFDRLRYRKLIEEDESWRTVKSPYDPQI